MRHQRVSATVTATRIQATLANYPNIKGIKETFTNLVPGPGCAADQAIISSGRGERNLDPRVSTQRLSTNTSRQRKPSYR